MVLARPAEIGASPGANAELWPAILKAACLLVLLVTGAMLLRHTGTGLLRSLHPNVAGAALLLGLGGAMTAAGVPRQVLAFAGGYTFGAPAGVAISLAGQMLGCALDYAAARSLAAGVAQRVLARPSARRLYRWLAAHPFTATLTLRLLPVSSNVMLNLLAGASRLPPRAFFGATILGYVPQTVVFALLGSGTQVGHGMQLAIGLGLFAVAMLLGVLLYRRTRGVSAPAF